MLRSVIGQDLELSLIEFACSNVTRREFKRTRNEVSLFVLAVPDVPVHYREGEKEGDRVLSKKSRHLGARVCAV